jgi:hypothetical protein
MYIFPPLLLLYLCNLVSERAEEESLIDGAC